ncbi:MAG TPA: YqcC family protein [Crenotrichaceae bacterium]|nr:YqcC family protein [Crenotrichaceae bacterium]
MTADTRTTVAELLLEIEAELRALERWSLDSPPVAALQSSLPFCCDTLEIEQWLQFVFIPRMNHLLETQAELPTDCRIAPYLEECSHCDNMMTGQLLSTLQQVDRILM